MPRLFTAIEIPEAIRMHLSLLRAPLAGTKWIEPENMHITLRFAGDIASEAIDGRFEARVPQLRPFAGMAGTPLRGAAQLTIGILQFHHPGHEVDGRA